MRSRCNNFICSYLKETKCSFSNLACSGVTCEGYHGNCNTCIVFSCVLRPSNSQSKQKVAKNDEIQEVRDVKEETLKMPLPEQKQGKIYAVRRGRVPGLYFNWNDCKKQISGYSNAEYKSFPDMKSAEDFMNAGQKNKDIPLKPFAYVDGSFYKDTYGYGGFIEDEDGTRHLLQGKGNDSENGSMRNVAGEIAGATAAIKFAEDNGYKTLTIYYDYSGIEKWATGEWKANKSGTIQYQQMAMSTPVKLRFEKVKGHSGVAGNEIADRLAKEAVGL